uniref:glutathione transferase n=1 Tax=Panagrolaimus superbus TaxID=310955 RepID=A0A914Y259_9BILA
MVHYKLTFFDQRGLAECIRLMFHYGGIEFEDNRISHTQWLKIKPTTKFGKMPILEVDGHPLCESLAICRYLAPKLRLMPNDSWENAQMESIVETYIDFHRDIKPYWIAAFGGPKVNDTLYKDLYIPLSDTYFNRISSILNSTKAGFLCNSGISWGDFYLAEACATLKGIDPDFGKRFPNIIEYQRKVHGLPQLQSYIVKRKSSTV